MKNGFDLDNPIMVLLSRVGDLIVLALLWLLFSLPVITIGASTTAMYQVTFSIAESDAPSVTKLFWTAFRKKFRQSTLFFSLQALALTVIGIEGCLLLNGDLPDLMAGMVLLQATLVLLFGGYFYPLIANFQLSFSAALKNAALLALGDLPTSLLVTLLDLLPLLTAVFLTELFLRTLILWCMFCAAVIAYLNTLLLRRVFRRYLTRPEEMECDQGEDKPPM